MGDPLSVISSVVGLVSSSASIARIAKQLYDSGKDAPESINRVREEMEHMHIIFSEVQTFFEGHGKRPQHSKLTLVSIHNLLTVLTGCVLVWSRLEAKLNDVAGLANPPTPAKKHENPAADVLLRVKWALWTQTEAQVILEDLQRYKTSLHMMLTLVQAKITDAQVIESQAKLNDLIDKITESETVTAINLRELIRKPQENNMTIPVNEPDTTSINTTSSSIVSCSGPSNIFDIDNSDRSSIMTTATTISVRSIMSFTEALANSRAYKKLSGRGRGGVAFDSQSVFSKSTGDTKGDRWSMLSELTLGDLSISEIAVLELPLSVSDVYNPSVYQHTGNLKSMGKAPGRAVLLKWKSRGRLHEATRAGNAFVVRTLLNLGADVEETRYLHFYDKTLERDDPRYITPLQYAVRLRDSVICQLLLDHGAAVDSTDIAGRTPLSYGAHNINGLAKLCKLLLDHGATVDSTDSIGRTPLSYAASTFGGGTDVCKLLLNHGAAVDSADLAGRTPLSYAADKGDAELCKLLISDHGATVDSTDYTGRTPLSYASVRGRIDLCELLLDHGAAVDPTDSTGRTPLSYAAYNGDTGLCKLLSDHGATLDSTDSTGRTPLSYASASSRFGTTRVLLGHGAAVDSTDFAGRTPLSYAAYNGHAGVCKVLSDHGATVDSTDSTGRTPLSYASASSRFGTISVCKVLLNNGATVDSTDYTGRTPLSYAVVRGSIDLCKLLLDHGAAVDSTDSSGYTPLHHASTAYRDLNDKTLICELLQCTNMVPREAPACAIISYSQAVTEL